PALPADRDPAAGPVRPLALAAAGGHRCLCLDRPGAGGALGGGPAAGGALRAGGARRRRPLRPGTALAPAAAAAAAGPGLPGPDPAAGDPGGELPGLPRPGPGGAGRQLGHPAGRRQPGAGHRALDPAVPGRFPGRHPGRLPVPRRRPARLAGRARSRGMSAPARRATAGPRAFRLRGLEVFAGGRRLLGPLHLDLHPGQCLGLVGESGSGKSLTVLALLGLLPAGLRVRGELELDQADGRSRRLALGAPEHLALRGRAIAWIPQDPLASLHPLRRVGSQLAEALRLHRRLGRAAARTAALALLARLDLPQPDALARRYPHQLSGGQRQRVLVALALAGRPALLLADEPTSALDPRLAGEALALLDRLREDAGLAVLLVSHDLPRVARHAGHLAVLHRGECVEQGPAAEVFARPAHAYTRDLLAASQLPPPPTPAPGPRLLELEDVRVHYRGAPAPAVAGIRLQLHRGECLALLGESGSGKSSLIRALLRLLRRGVGGRVLLDGEDLLTADRPRLRALRRRIGVVFQDPTA